MFYVMRWIKLDLSCIYFQKNKLIHHYFKSSPFNCSNWITRMNFFSFFWPSKIYVSSTDVVSSLSPLRCRLSSGWRCHIVTPCHASFPWTQDELAGSASFSDNTLSRSLPGWAETKVLNLHHHHQPPFLDNPTPTIHCYKKIISILITLPTNQSHLYFVSSLTRAPRHQISTYHCHSLSSSSHTNSPFT
jgi:hypothetical protein